MTRQCKILRFGILLYVASFFLIAATGAGSNPNAAPIRGITCAVVALIAPWVWISEWGNGILPKLIPAVIIVGWVNPLFLSTIMFAIRKQRRRSVVILRTVIVTMLASSWFVYFYEEMHPREGFFLWVAGILVVLFSAELAGFYAYCLGSGASA